MIEHLTLGMCTIDSLGFGLGNQACLGRFLAVNSLKLMMAKLMIGWELTLEKNGQEFQGPRPSMEYCGVLNRGNKGEKGRQQ